MLTAKVFQCGNDQAILIPDEIQLSENEYAICKSGDCFFLLPSRNPWSLLQECLGKSEEEA